MVFCSTPTFFAIVVIAKSIGFWFGYASKQSSFWFGNATKMIIFGLEMHLKNGIFGLEMLGLFSFGLLKIRCIFAA